MKLLRKASFASIMIAASMFATSANAAQFINITGPSGTFGDDDVTCATTSPCTFTRSFAFVTPAGFNNVSVDISSIATTNPLTNIDFTSVMLNGVSFNTISTGTQEFRNLLNQSLVAGASNVLNVSGTSGGNAAFTGNLSFSSASVAAVPEPTTWMLMLLGMAGIGFSMRRKSAPTLRVRYT